ncbi:MAG: hypothetical protein Q9174_002401 [Haloplaca sp. 1 TL-2023]
MQPDIKVLQIQLTGFLEKDTPKFCKELWTLCLSAQNSPQGVPKEMLEAKKAEILQQKQRHSNAVLNKNKSETGMSTASDNVSAPNEGEVQDEPTATDHIIILTGAHQGVQGLHLSDVAHPLTGPIIVGLHYAITSIRTFLATEVGDETIVVILLLGALFAAHAQGPLHLLGVGEATRCVTGMVAAA